MSEKEKIGLIDGDKVLSLLYERVIGDRVELHSIVKSCRVPIQPAKIEPADLAAAGLAGWAVVEEIKSWLIEKAPRIKSPDEPVRVLNVDSFEKAIAELESKHSAALDKYRRLIEDAKAWKITEKWLETWPDQFRDKLAGQEGEKK